MVWPDFSCGTRCSQGHNYREGEARPGVSTVNNYYVRINSVWYLNPYPLTKQDVSATSSYSTTTTVSTTTTSTATTITTTSTTSTLTLTSTSSVYAACTATSNNILGPQTPNGLLEAITDSNTFVITMPGSPYDCCVQCQLSNTCAGTFYSVGSQDTDGQCVQVQSNQCGSQSGFSRK